MSTFRQITLSFSPAYQNNNLPCAEICSTQHVSIRFTGVIYQVTIILGHVYNMVFFSSLWNKTLSKRILNNIVTGVTFQRREVLNWNSLKYCDLPLNQLLLFNSMLDSYWTNYSTKMSKWWCKHRRIPTENLTTFNIPQQMAKCKLCTL